MKNTPTTLLTVLFCNIFSFLQAQEYLIRGTGADSLQQLYLYHVGTHQKDTATRCGNDAFTFSGNAEGRPFALLQTNTGISIPLLLKDTLDVNVANLKVSGEEENETLSQWNIHFSELQKELRLLQEDMEGFRKEFDLLPDSILRKVGRRQDALNSQFTSDLLMCCKMNRYKTFPAFFLAQHHQRLPKENLMELAEERPAYLGVPMTARLMKTIQGWCKRKAGQPFADLELPDTAGTPRRLSDFAGRGEYVLLDFWASWCGPCRSTLPQLKQLYEKYHEEGLEIVSISFDSSKKAWTGAIEKMALPWVHLSDLRGWDSAANALYGITALPATLLIGPDGRIVASDLELNALKRKLEELFLPRQQ